MKSHDIAPVATPFCTNPLSPKRCIVSVLDGLISSSYCVIIAMLKDQVKVKGFRLGLSIGVRGEFQKGGKGRGLVLTDER